MDQLAHAAMRLSPTWFLLQLSSRMLLWFCHHGTSNGQLVLIGLFFISASLTRRSCRHPSLSRHQSFASPTGLKSQSSSLLKCILRHINCIAASTSSATHLSFHSPSLYLNIVWHRTVRIRSI